MYVFQTKMKRAVSFMMLPYFAKIVCVWLLNRVLVLHYVLKGSPLDEMRRDEIPCTDGGTASNMKGRCEYIE